MARQQMTADFFHQLVDQVRDAVIVMTTEGKLTYVNQAMTKLYGYEAAELLTMSVHELRAPDTLDDFPDQIKKALSEGIVFECTHKKKNGALFPVEISSHKIRVHSNDYLVSIIRDITERTNITKDLQEKALQIQAVIQLLPDIFYFKDMDLRYTMINKALEDFLGLPANEIIGKQSEDIVTAEWAAQIRTSDEEAFHQGTLIRQEQELFTPEHRWMDSYKIPLHNAQGEIIGLIGSSHDITALKLKDLALNERTRALEHSVLQLQKSWHQTIEVLATTSEAKDPYTSGHQKRVMQLSDAIGRELGLEEDVLLGLRMAAMVHDIGKIKVPAELLSKPGILSALERQLINTHAMAGYEILKDLDLPWNVAKMVKQHHERHDGTGYPDGLKGEEIELNARILGVADVVEAMASHRPYRPARGIEAALSEINQGSGTLYDPTVAAACLTVFLKQGFEFE
ncbi:MAG TPA: HD domain-containing phosphohydrolase [Negativicutes bacterium]|nr:HD domain-containing phosphohydrolase [Negativicutes bacterium]